MKRTTILVADGMTVFRAAVGNVLAREQDFDVVEAASTGEVRRLVRKRPIDTALVDLGLPGGGIEAIEPLRTAGAANVIVWSFRPDPQTVFAAIRAGAIGYLPKEISPESLVRSIRGAARGEAPLSRELMTLMIAALHGAESRLEAREQAASLSDREREVLAHVAAGDRNRQIAAALSISQFTVKRHVQNILNKLDLGSRGDAAAFYRAAFVADRQSAH